MSGRIVERERLRGWGIPRLTERDGPVRGQRRLRRGDVQEDRWFAWCSLRTVHRGPYFSRSGVKNALNKLCQIAQVIRRVLQEPIG